MKTKTIYVLRHGETDLNKKGMVQGRGVNASLNDTGRLQSKKAFEALKDKPIKTIFTSSLNRSIETVAPWRNGEVSIYSHDGFDEISWGNQEGKEASYEAKNLYADTVKGWQEGNLDLNVGGGESPIQVMKRQQEAMEYVFEKGEEHTL
ncbi:MAG: histidine phosphatase family protein, partial [Bacteroidota bacterium]